MANRRQRKKNLKRVLQAGERLRTQMDGFDLQLVEALGMLGVWRRVKADLAQLDTWRAMAGWQQGAR